MPFYRFMVTNSSNFQLHYIIINRGFQTSSPKTGVLLIILSLKKKKKKKKKNNIVTELRWSCASNKYSFCIP